MKKGFIRDYQTPPEVCRYMASLIPSFCQTILEPTPGKGNLVKAISDGKRLIVAPEDYFLLDKSLKFDCVVMNPPFSVGSLETKNKPASFKATGMDVGYQILFDCMLKSNHVIALMPWYTISDSDVRLRYLKNWGLQSVTLLPRSTFQYARIQTVILELDRYLPKNHFTEFRVYDLLPTIPCPKEKMQIKANLI